MALKDLISKAESWLKSRTAGSEESYRPEVDSEGLLSDAEQKPETAEQEMQKEEENHVVVKPVESVDKAESLEKLQKGFNQLIGELEGINGHLDKQAKQHEQLMERLEKLPELLSSFPSIVENQSKLTSELLENLKNNASKNQQLQETIERIPAETSKQTEALVNINHQLAASADTDVQMAESFNKFNETIGKLNQSTLGQTDSIMQMSRTFATSDRYLKYLMTKQNKRFMWVFMTSIFVCLGVILSLVGIIIYLKQ